MLLDYSALAQLVEQMTVNHWVAGSSPAGGATYFMVMFDPDISGNIRKLFWLSVLYMYASLCLL